MRILLSVAVWGRSYSVIFANYSLASLLSPNNLPRLAADHEIAFHIVTDRADAKWLLQQSNVQALERLCPIIWEFIEDHGYEPNLIPVDFDNEKYPFLSRLQNIAFERSLGFDFLVFNYADFIWADGALCNTIALIDDKVDAILSFCLPVDQDDGKRALAPYRAEGDEAGVLNIPSRAAAAIAIEHMHREARLRIWDNPEFTSTPTYLIWRVEPDGLLVRAYHQTVLALRVRPNDADYRAGIPRGSLDGYFTNLLAEKGGIRHAVDSDQVSVFSLHHAQVSSAVRSNEHREDIVRDCLRASVSPAQRRFAETPFLVKGSYTAPSAWLDISEHSRRILTQLHEAAPSNQEAFEHNYAARGELVLLDRRWVGQSRTRSERLRIWFYRKIVAQLISGPTGRIARTLLGPKQARAISMRMHVWIFGDHHAP
ncbi:MAG: hypothetical protein JWN71_4304 [Xanthobacteraceae bacterium]|nr:hypothetical protein [Xanthobacteraceae bacterium]